MLLLAGRARGLAALRVGPVGARRVKAVALGGAALMATQQEADCAAGQNLRVASFRRGVIAASILRVGDLFRIVPRDEDVVFSHL